MMACLSTPTEACRCRAETVCELVVGLVIDAHVMERHPAQDAARLRVEATRMPTVEALLRQCALDGRHGSDEGDA